MVFKFTTYLFECQGIKNEESKRCSEYNRKLGYNVRYVPDEIIEDYNAYYRVKYGEKTIFLPTADKLDIPLNEIWLSKKWREFEKYTLYHELMEIKHRVEGHSPKNAHMLTIRDAEERYSGDPKHERLKREINGVSKETFTDLLGIDGDPFQIVMKNRPYHSID